MTDYRIVNLSAMVEELGENAVKAILSDFSCPLNPDIEFYLSQKAIEFAMHGWAQTHLVYAPIRKEVSPSNKDQSSESEDDDVLEWVLVGYFALSGSKCMRIPASTLGKSGSKLRSRINQFATYDGEAKSYILPAPLIAQLGKNYANGYDKLITGDELLAEACNKIKRMQFDMGGKFAYLECEDKPQLTSFYKRNGFWEFDKRKLDKDETDKLDGEYLVQMLKYFHRDKKRRR